jgi:hypothetical protein
MHCDHSSRAHDHRDVLVCVTYPHMYGRFQLRTLSRHLTGYYKDKRFSSKNSSV